MSESSGHRPAGRAAGRRLLPHPRRAVRHHAAGRPRRRGDQGRGPGGDDTRTWQPPVRDGVATYYLGVNRNKRSIALDFADAGRRGAGPRAGRPGRHRDRELPARRAGPVRPGLRRPSPRGNPKIIYASISGFGSGEKGAALPGYDLIVQAISGLMSLTGDPDGPAYRAGISVFDVMAGLHATIGVLAALHQRHETGRGQHVEVNLLSSALSGLVNHSSAYVAGGMVPFRMGNSHPSLFPYEPLPCADGDLIITAGNDGQFAQAVRGAGPARAGRRPAVRPQPGPDRQPGRAAAAAGGAAGDPDQARVVPRHHRRRRAVRADQHHRRRGRVRRARSAWTRWSRSARKAIPCPACGTRSPSPRAPPEYRLPPPGLDEHGAEIRAWLEATPSRAMTEPCRSSPPRWAPPTPTTSGCSARTWPPT